MIIAPLLIFSITLLAFCAAVILAGLERRPIWVELATGFAMTILLIGLMALAEMVDNTANYTEVRIWLNNVYPK
jgi:hypothetical protein